MIWGVAVLAVVTIAIKAAGTVLPPPPPPLARRLSGLAPALLAALVVSELRGSSGWPTLDAKAAGVAVAVVLATVRAPLAVSVVAGAAVAALLRTL